MDPIEVKPLNDLQVAAIVTARLHDKRLMDRYVIMRPPSTEYRSWFAVVETDMVNCPIIESSPKLRGLNIIKRRKNKCSRIIYSEHNRYIPESVEREVRRANNRNEVMLGLAITAGVTFVSSSTFTSRTKHYA